MLEPPALGPLRQKAPDLGLPPVEQGPSPRVLPRHGCAIGGDEVYLVVEEISLDLAGEVLHPLLTVGAAGQVEEEGGLDELASGQDGDPRAIIVRDG